MPKIIFIFCERPYIYQTINLLAYVYFNHFALYIKNDNTRFLRNMFFHLKFLKIKLFSRCIFFILILVICGPTRNVGSNTWKSFLGFFENEHKSLSEHQHSSQPPSREKLSSCHKFCFSNLYFYATQYRRTLIFLTINSAKSAGLKKYRD